MNRLLRTINWLLLLSIIAAGCHSKGEPVPEITAAVEAPAPTTAPPVKPESKSAPTPDLATPKMPTAHVAEFTPPFPERLELFEPPKQLQNSVRRDDEQGESVELKGFINVDQPRVLLSIDGVIAPIPEGGEKYGVQVISIQPPTVVLQRGRNRRTLTLE